MVDDGRVVRLLRAISERAQRLDAAFATAEADRGDLWLDGVKYLLVTTIEAVVDVAQHIVSSEDFGAPDSNAAAVRALGAHTIVPVELAERLALAVGFRNVLVHQYADVDDSIVLAAHGRLQDFDEFVSEVSGWLAEP